MVSEFGLLLSRLRVLMIIFIIRLKRRFSGGKRKTSNGVSWQLVGCSKPLFIIFLLFCDCGGISIYFLVAKKLIERGCDVNSNHERFAVDVGIVRQRY